MLLLETILGSFDTMFLNIYQVGIEIALNHESSCSESPHSAVSSNPTSPPSPSSNSPFSLDLMNLLEFAGTRMGDLLAMAGISSDHQERLQTIKKSATEVVTSNKSAQSSLNLKTFSPNQSSSNKSNQSFNRNFNNQNTKKSSEQASQSGLFAFHHQTGYFDPTTATDIDSVLNAFSNGDTASLTPEFLQKYTTALSDGTDHISNDNNNTKANGSANVNSDTSNSNNAAPTKSQNGNIQPNSASELNLATESADSLSNTNIRSKDLSKQKAELEIPESAITANFQNPAQFASITSNMAYPSESLNSDSNTPPTHSSIDKTNGDVNINLSDNRQITISPASTNPLHPTHIFSTSSPSSSSLSTSNSGTPLRDIRNFCNTVSARSSPVVGEFILNNFDSAKNAHSAACRKPDAGADLTSAFRNPSLSRIQDRTEDQEVNLNNNRNQNQGQNQVSAQELSPSETQKGLSPGTFTTDILKSFSQIRERPGALNQDMKVFKNISSQTVIPLNVVPTDPMAPEGRDKPKTAAELFGDRRCPLGLVGNINNTNSNNSSNSDNSDNDSIRTGNNNFGMSPQTNSDDGSSVSTANISFSSTSNSSASIYSRSPYQHQQQNHHEPGSTIAKPSLPSPSHPPPFSGQYFVVPGDNTDDDSNNSTIVQTISNLPSVGNYGGSFSPQFNGQLSGSSNGQFNNSFNNQYDGQLNGNGYVPNLHGVDSCPSPFGSFSSFSPFSGANNNNSTRSSRQASFSKFDGTSMYQMPDIESSALVRGGSACSWDVNFGGHQQPFSPQMMSISCLNGFNGFNGVDQMFGSDPRSVIPHAMPDIPFIDATQMSIFASQTNTRADPESNNNNNASTNVTANSNNTKSTNGREAANVQEEPRSHFESLIPATHVISSPPESCISATSFLTAYANPYSFVSRQELLSAARKYLSSCQGDFFNVNATMLQHPISPIYKTFAEQFFRYSLNAVLRAYVSDDKQELNRFFNGTFPDNEHFLVTRTIAGLQMGISIKKSKWFGKVEEDDQYPGYWGPIKIEEVLEEEKLKVEEEMREEKEKQKKMGMGVLLDGKENVSVEVDEKRLIQSLLKISSCLGTLPRSRIVDAMKEIKKAVRFS